MFEAQALEMPFMAEMPRREKSKVMRVWDSFQELSKIAETEGIPIPQAFAAKVLDVSTQRVSQLAQEGRLKVVQVNGHPFVTENSVVAYAQSERTAGRPLKNLESNSWSAAARMAKELHGEAKKRQK